MNFPASGVFCVLTSRSATPLALASGSAFCRGTGQAGVVHVGADDGDARHAAADGADDVHLAHRPAGADRPRRSSPGRISPVARDVPVGLGGVAAGGADPAGHAVVDPADADGDRRADPLAAQHDVDDAAGGELVVEDLDRRLVGAEVDDVVEALVGQGGQVRGRVAARPAAARARAGRGRRRRR